MKILSITDFNLKLFIDLILRIGALRVRLDIFGRTQTSLQTKRSLARYHWLIFALTFILVYPLYAATPAIKIIIKGVDKNIEENIQSNLSLLQEREEESSFEIENYSELAKHEVSMALEPFGYYHPQIQTQSQLIKSTWHITFDIQTGPPIQVKDFHFELKGEGERDPTLQHLYNIFPLKKGYTFEHETYEQGKKDLLATAIQSGYLNAQFSVHRVEVNTDTNTCEIYLSLDTGYRHFFGAIAYHQTILSPKLLNRYLDFAPGDLYTPEKVMKLQSDLTQSDYFSQVNVKPLINEGSTIVPLTIELEDAKPNQYIIGGGYGTDTGVRGKLGWTRRTLNKYGHRFSAQAQVSEIYHKAFVEYSIPGRHPQTDHLNFNGGYYEDEFSAQHSEIFEGSVLQLREINTWQRKLSLTYHHERFLEFNTDEKINTQLILPSVTFIQMKRDDKVAPTKGRRIEFSMKGSLNALFSETSFFQSYLQIRWLHSFNETTKGLIRTELGFTLPDEVEQLPLSQRFFAGGDLSLRGYGYRSLPNEIDKNGDSHPPGGTYLAIGSIELDKMIKPPFGLFTFVDAGNAFRKDANEIAMGIGVGVQWQTRLGPIKIAIAKPLTKQADSYRIHATFGPEL